VTGSGDCMPFKAKPGEKCFTHQEPVTSLCAWCGKSICDSCINAANGRKYCVKCAKLKMKSYEPTGAEKNRFGERPREPIRNVDPTLR